MTGYNPLTSNARARLLRTYNDIDIFVEDDAQHTLYVRLFTRMLGRRASISSVISLGGRANVIERCAKDQAIRARPRLYIIDGDLDLLTGAPKRRLKHLYRLNVYCAENLVATEHAAICVAQDKLASESYEVVSQMLGIDEMLRNLERKVSSLFVLYAVIHRLGLSLQTSSYPVQRLLCVPSDPSTISAAKVRTHMRILVAAVLATVPKRRYIAAKRIVRARIARMSGSRLGFISGKTYIQPLIELQLRSVAGIQDTRTAITARLAAHSETNVDPRLEGALRRALRSA
jgi:hypothetical protein